MNHPAFRQFLLAEQADRLDHVARSHRPSAKRDPATPAEAEVVLRLCTVHDDEDLDRLAVLEGKPLPRGRFVLAFVDGDLVAAQPLDGGEPLADPFRPTAHVLPLMRLRARQLTASAGRRRLPLIRWSAVRL
jgi:hypothetical protein